MTTPFPLAEEIVITALADLPGVNGVSVETPDNLDEQLPWIRVERSGGNDDVVTDNARVDIHVFAASRHEAAELSETVRTTLHDILFHVITGRHIDNIRTEMAPRFLDYGNPRIHRYISTYLVSSRRAWWSA